MFRIAKALFALELAVVMIGIYIITDTCHFSMKDYDKLQEFPYTGIYFSTFHDHTDGSFQRIRKEIEGKPKFCGWGYTRQDLVGDEELVISFDRWSSQLFSMEPDKGKWFSETKKMDGKVPCVIVANGKEDADVGDTLSMGGINYIVTGVVSSEKQFFDISGSYGNSSGFALSSFQTGQFMGEYRTILCCADLCHAEDEVIFDDKTSVIAYFDKSLSEKEMAGIRKIMEKEGVTESFDELKQVTFRECYYKVMEYLPFCVLIFFVSIMGVITSTVMNSKKIIRKYGIFALYGGKWQKVLLGYFGKLFLLAVFMSLLAALYACQAQIYYSSVLMINLSISLMYALLGAGILHLIKGRRNIMECIRWGK